MLQQLPPVIPSYAVQCKQARIDNPTRVNLSEPLSLAPNYRNAKQQQNLGYSAPFSIHNGLASHQLTRQREDNSDIRQQEYSHPTRQGFHVTMVRSHGVLIRCNSSLSQNLTTGHHLSRQWSY